MWKTTLKYNNLFLFAGCTVSLMIKSWQVLSASADSTYLYLDYSVNITKKKSFKNCFKGMWIKRDTDGYKESA